MGAAKLKPSAAASAPIARFDFMIAPNWICAPSPRARTRPSNERYARWPSASLTMVKQ
jgi:hypothetical protein